MNNELTELVFILDMSGSMSHLTDDTIGGFNSLIEKQKKEAGKCLVSCVLFNHRSIVFLDRKKLEEVEPMDRRDYVPGGNTALLDAVGGAIHHIGNIHKYAREEDRPGKTLFVIVTDGRENSSRDYSWQTVKSMIERQKERYGWEFIYLASDLSALDQSRNLGINLEDAVFSMPTKRGTSDMFESVSLCCCEVRFGSEDRMWRQEQKRRVAAERTSRRDDKV